MRVFFLGFLFILAFSIPKSYGQDVNIDQGLMLHMDFNANLRDLSGVRRDGELLGACYAMDRFGNCEFALGFDDYLQLARLDETAMDRLQDFSVSIWFRKEGSGFGTFLSAANSARNNEFNINILDNGVIASNIRNVPNVPGIRIDGNVNVADGNWHHVVMTRDGASGDTYIYVDGLQDGFKVMPLGEIQLGSNGFVFGNDQDCLAGCYSANQQFRGQLDDFRVYNRVINRNEINALFAFTDGVVDTKVRGGSKDLSLCAESAELSIERAFDSYQWSTGSSQPSITVTTSGEYTVTGMIKDCEYTDTVNVTLNQLPEMIIAANGTDLACTNNLVITATEGFDDYTWQDGSSGETYSVTSPGRYQVKGVNDCGEAVSNTIDIIESQLFELQITSSASFITCGETIILEANNGFTGYLWDTGETGRTIEVTGGGIYSLTVSDQCGEVQSMSVSITNSENPTYFVPNAFTPNDDGKNDFFEIDERLLGSSLKVVDRWGKRLYLNQAYDNSWDGGSLTDGTYYAIINGPCLAREIKLWIQILR